MAFPTPLPIQQKRRRAKQQQQPPRSMTSGAESLGFRASSRAPPDSRQTETASSPLRRSVPPAPAALALRLLAPRCLTPRINGCSDGPLTGTITLFALNKMRIRLYHSSKEGARQKTCCFCSFFFVSFCFSFFFVNTHGGSPKTIPGALDQRESWTRRIAHLAQPKPQSKLIGIKIAHPEPCFKN